MRSTLRTPTRTPASDRVAVHRGFGEVSSGPAAHAFAGVDVSPPGGVIQRVFKKADGSDYANYKKSAWYQQLTPRERTEADKLHGESTDHLAQRTTSATLAYVRGRIAAASTTPTPSPSPGVTPPSSAVVSPSAPAPLVAPSPITTPPAPSLPTATATTSSAPDTSTSTDDFFGRIGYGSGYLNKAVVEDDDDTDVTSASQGSDHYRDLLLKDLRKARQAENDAPDSSDSETEVGSDPDRGKRRRQYKAAHLTALARTFWPLSDEEMDYFGKLSSKRERDNKDRAKKRQMYARDTREQLEEVGEQFKLTNFHHNPYLRRAVRKAWPKEKIKKGGSKEYDDNQGKVRTQLLKVVQADHEKMKWKREDFPDDESWNAVQWMMKNEMGNSSTQPLYHAKADAHEDTSGTSARVGFHHEAFKEAMGGDFAPFALTPVNLTALNDRRELLNASKVKKIKSTGGQLPPVGAHDKFGHQGSGFLKTQKGKMARAKGGGQFNDMDAEAVYHITRPLYQRRTPKATLYDVPKTSTSTPVALSAPTPMDASSTSTSTPVAPPPLVTPPLLPPVTPPIPSLASLLAAASPSPSSSTPATLFPPPSHASPFATSSFGSIGSSMAPSLSSTPSAPTVTSPSSIRTMMAPVHPLMSHSPPFTLPAPSPLGRTMPPPAFPFPPISSLYGTPTAPTITPPPSFATPPTPLPVAPTTPRRPRKRGLSARTPSPPRTTSPSPSPRRKRPRHDPPS